MSEHNSLTYSYNGKESNNNSSVENPDAGCSKPSYKEQMKNIEILDEKNRVFRKNVLFVVLIRLIPIFLFFYFFLFIF